MRIQVDPGALQPGGFDAVSQELTGQAGRAIGALEGASGAAGDPSLATSILDFADALMTSARAAALATSSLSEAMTKAGQLYADQERAIGRQERFR